LSTRGPRRWCPTCRGQIYFHHADANNQDVWYCQGCGKEVTDFDALHEHDEKVKSDDRDREQASRDRIRKDMKHGDPHR